MPISPTLPTDGQSDWDVPLNAALTEIIDEVNAQETDIAGKADTSHTHDVDDINATGTPSSTTYLRGDGTWSTPAGGGGGAVDSVNGATGDVVLDQDDVLDGTTYKQYSATEKTKLAGIATGATANSSDATLLNRSNHTGTQASSTISDFEEAVEDLIGANVAGTGLISASYNDTSGVTTVSTTATANDTDANLKARANHTGTQTASTISDFASTVYTTTAADSTSAGIAAVNTVATSGSTETLSGAYSLHKVTMDQNCTFSFTSPSAGAVFALLLSGSFTPTFPGAVDWPDATPPTYSSPSLYVFSTFDAGTTWYGVQAGKAFA